MLAATTPAVIRPQERAQQDDKHYTKTAFLKDPDMSMAALAFMQGVFVVMHQVGREICVYPPSLSSTLPYPPGFFSISFPLPPLPAHVLPCCKRQTCSYAGVFPHLTPV